MANMNLFDFSRINSIDDAAQKFVDISKGINGTVQITATQITKFQEAVEKLYTETEKTIEQLDGKKDAKIIGEIVSEKRQQIFNNLLKELGDQTKTLQNMLVSPKAYAEFEKKISDIMSGKKNSAGLPYQKEYSALQGTMSKIVGRTIKSAVGAVRSAIIDVFSPEALEKIALGEMRDVNVDDNIKNIITSQGIKFKSARTKARKIQRATGRIHTEYQLKAVKEYIAAGSDAQKMQEALKYDERTNRQIQQSAEQMKRVGIKTADQVEQSCKVVEQRMTAATEAYENMGVAEHRLSRAMEAGSAVSYLKGRFGKAGKEFVEGTYKNTIVAQIYAGNKEQIKQAQEAMQSSQTLEGLLTQLQNKIRTKSKGTQQLRVVYDEAKQGLQLLSMTNAEVSAYEAAEKSGGGAGNAYLRKFMRESGRSVFVSTGGGAGSTIGMDRVRGGMSFANTPAIYVDSSGRAVSGTRIEADIAGLINVLETGVKTVQDAFAITKANIAGESTTAFRGESVAHRSAGQATITAQNALNKVTYVVAKQYGMSEENAFKMLSDVVLKLSQFHSDKTGTYDWDAVAKEVTDFQDVVPRLMGTTKITLEGIATQLRRWSLDIAGSAANATETGVYGLAPAAWMSPGGDISAEHSRHPQQATKYGEYTEETITARTRETRNQAAIVNEKTAALYGDNIGKAVEELKKSGDLMVSNILNIHEEYLRELFLKYRESLKDDLAKVTDKLKKATDKKERESLEKEKKELEAEFPKTLGGISGDAMLMRESLMAETSGLHKDRKQEVSASRYKELHAKYNGDARKMLEELRPDIDIGKITELKTEKNESGSITFVFTERQDLMESRKVGGAYTADRNLASAVSDRFLTFLQKILGVDSIDAIKLGEEAGLNNRGGRLLAIIQHIYDQLYDKSKKKLTTEGEEFVKRITTDSDSPFKGFLTFSNGLFSTHTQTDANGNQKYINAQEAFKYLLLSNYGDKFAGGAIGSGSDFGQSKEDFYMMSEALNMLYDFEYNNPGGYGVREYAAIGRKLKAYQRESGKDLSQTIAYYQEEQEDIDKKAAALKERINKNIADASVANYTKRAGDIVIGSGDDADIKISSIDADQLAKLEYAAGDITAESYAGSIYQKIDEAFAARAKQIEDDLRSDGKTEDEITAAVKEFRESARIIVRGQENMPLAAGVQDSKGRVYGGGQLAFTYMSPRANLDFGSGAPESYQVAETLDGMVSLLRGIINVNDLIKDGVDATEEIAKLTDLGTGILKRQIDSVTDKDSALQKQIYKHELKNSGWFAIANIDDEAISDDDDVNKHLKDVVNRGVGASREKIRKLIGNDIGFLRNQYAYMYGKEADKAWSAEQLQNEILDAADPRNAKYKAGKYIRANINRYPDFDNMMDVRHGIVYVDSTLTGDSVGNVTNAFASGMQGDFDKDHIFVNVMQGKRLAQMSVKEYDRWMKEQEEIERRDQAWVQFNKNFLAANQMVDDNGKIQYDSYFGADKETHDRIKEVVAVAQRNNRSKAGLWSSAHSKFTNALQDSGIEDSDLGFALSRMGEFVFGMTEQNVVGYKHLIDAALKRFGGEKKNLTKEQITQTYNDLLAQGDKMLTDLNSLENNYDLSSHFEAMVNNGLIKSSNGVLKGGNPTEARYIWSMFEGVKDKKAVFDQLQEIAQKAGTSLSYEMFGLKEENGDLVRADATADFAKLPIEFVKAMMKQLQSTFYDRTGMQLVSGNFGSGAQVGAMARRKYANADNQKANTDAQYAEYLKSLGIRPINTEKLEGSLNGNTTALNDIGKYLQQIISILSGGGGPGGYGGAGDASKFGTGHSYGYTAHDIADLVFPPNISSYGKKIDADDLTERVLKTAGFSDKNIPNFYYLSKGQGNEQEYSELTNKYIDSLNTIGETTHKAAMKAFGFTSKKDFDKAADSAISRIFGSYVHAIADQRALNERGVTDTKKEDDVRRYNAELRAQMRYLGFSQEEIESKVSSAVQYVEEIFKTVEKNFGKIRASELRLSDSASGRSNLTHGILDALSVDENGNITILDWKTGHDRITDNEKTQVRVYQALAEQLRGEMKARYDDDWNFRNAVAFDEEGNIKEQYKSRYKQKEDEIIDAVYGEFVKRGGSRFGSKEDITQFMRILYENQGGRGGFGDQDIKSGIILINPKGQVVTWSGGKVDESGLARLIRTPSDVTEADRDQFTSGVETLPGGSVSSASKKSTIIAAINKKKKLEKELLDLEITQGITTGEIVDIKNKQIAEEKKKIKTRWKKGEEGAPDEVDRKAIRLAYRSAKSEVIEERTKLEGERESKRVSEAKKAVDQLYKDRKELANKKALLDASTEDSDKKLIESEITDIETTEDSDKKLIESEITDIENRIETSRSQIDLFKKDDKITDEKKKEIDEQIRKREADEAASRIKTKTAEDVKAEVARTKAKNEYISQLKEELRLKKEIFDLENKRGDTEDNDLIEKYDESIVAKKAQLQALTDKMSKYTVKEGSDEERERASAFAAYEQYKTEHKKTEEESRRDESYKRAVALLGDRTRLTTEIARLQHLKEAIERRGGEDMQDNLDETNTQIAEFTELLKGVNDALSGILEGTGGASREAWTKEQKDAFKVKESVASSRAQRGVHKEQLQADIEYTKEYTDLLAKERELSVKVGGYQRDAATSTGKLKQNLIIVQESYNKELEETRRKIAKINEEEAAAAKEGKSRIKDKEIIDAQNELARDQAMKALYAKKPYSNIFEYIKADIGRATQRIVDFGLAAKVLNTARKEIQQVYQNILKLNEAMTNLRIVTGSNTEQAKSMMNTYNDLAMQLGTTTQAVAQSAAEWLRQGYSVSEANELIKSSTYLSRLGFMDMGQSVTALTSVMKGFRIEATNSMDIVDKLTQLDAKYATTAGDIATALSRTSAVAREAGLSLDQTAAALTTMIDVSQQDASSVGNAFRTILARYGNVKATAFTSLVGDSEDIDDANGSINDTEKVLGAIGIKIRSSSSDMRDFDDVMDELADKWVTLTDVEKNAVSTALAGVRQRNIFGIYMENYDTYKQAISEAEKAEGTAARKMQAYNESIAYSINQLSAAWEGFAQKLEASGAVKLFFQLLTVSVENFGRILSQVASTIVSLRSFKLTTDLKRLADFFGFGASDGKGRLKTKWDKTKAWFSPNRMAQQAAQEKEKYEQQRAGTYEEQSRNKIVNSNNRVVDALNRNADALDRNSAAQRGEKTPQTGGSKSSTEPSNNQTAEPVESAPEVHRKGWLGLTGSTISGAGYFAAKKARKNIPLLEQQIKNLKASGNFDESTSSGLANIWELQELTDQLEKDQNTLKVRDARVKELKANWKQGAIRGIGTGLTAGVISGMSSEGDVQDKIVAGASTAIMTGLISAIPGVGTILGPILGPVLGGFFGKEINKLLKADEVARKERVEDAKKQLEAIKEIGDSVTGLIDLNKKDQSLWDSDDWKQFNEQVETINEALEKSELGDKIIDLGNKTQTLSQYFADAVSTGNRDMLARVEAERIRFEAEKTYAAGEQDRYILQKEINENQKKLAKLDDDEISKQRELNAAIKAARAGIESYSEALKKGYMQASFYSSGVGTMEAYDIGNATLDRVIMQIAREWAKDSPDIFAGNQLTSDARSDIISYLREQPGYASLFKNDTKNVGDMLTARDAVGKLREEIGMSQKQLKEFANSKDLLEIRKRFKKIGDDIEDINQLSEADKSAVYKLIDKINLVDEDGITTIAHAMNMTVQEFERANADGAFNWLTTDVAIGGIDKLNEKMQTFNDLLSAASEGSLLTSENLNKIANQFPTLLRGVDEAGKYTKDLSSDNILDNIIRMMTDEDSLREIYSGLFSGSVAKDSEIWNNFMTLGKGSEIAKSNLSEDIKERVKKAGSYSDIVDIFSRPEMADYNDAFKEYVTSMYPITDLLDTQAKILEEYGKHTLEAEISNLESVRDSLDDVNKQREKELELIKAKEALENASKEKKRVYRAGVGFVYTTDQEAVKSAQEKVDELGRQRDKDNIQYQIDSLQQQKEILENIENNKQLESLIDTAEKILDGDGSSGGIAGIITAVNSITSDEFINKIKEQVKTAITESTQKTNDESKESAHKSYKEAQSSLEDFRKEEYVTPGGEKTGYAKGDILDNPRSPYYSSVYGEYKSKIDSVNEYAENYNKYVQDNSEKISKEKVDESKQKFGFFAPASGLKGVMGAKSGNVFVFGISPSSNPNWASNDQYTAGNSSNIYISKQTDNGGFGGFKQSPWKGTAEEAINKVKGPALIVNNKGGKDYLIYKDVNGEIHNTVVRLNNGDESLDGELSYDAFFNGKVFSGSNGLKALRKMADNYNPFASGTLSAPGGRSLINENGLESIITPSGTITSLPAKSGIIPADLTRNLWALGEVAPNLIARLGGNSLQTNNSNSSTDNSINIQNLDATFNTQSDFDGHRFLTDLRNQVILTANNH